MPEKGAHLPPLSRSELLEIFDSDPGLAEGRYRELYQKLTRYFEWSRQPDPDDLAQEALKRGFGRLQEGQKITVDDPASYFFGIARNLLRERANSRKVEKIDEHQMARGQRLFLGLDATEQFVFLKECLRKLPRGDFDLLSAYVEGEVEAWSKKVGISAGTVRMRIYRIRKRLELLLDSRGNDEDV
jgi:DNA-directed RNA polymerase specialized sigma24 family protein